ncbi:Sec-independent protein translocase protein TatB [Pannonibacter tanglangensis]|uniref:Sec-independent protein translocase protein TatB n=1 Tax=Pannonibacter tanglangensis TaxID=2750084 RepID=UPI0015D103B8|nr:Sec-independent protein translocase protein TatB [Pannonibacter sp. XCT-53]
MFDVGWTELLVIAVVAIIVVGPKDLPRMLRAFGQTVGKMRRMANEFQSTFNDALKEAEREADILDMKKAAEDAARGVQNYDPLADLKKTISQPLTLDEPAADRAAETPLDAVADAFGGAETDPAPAATRPASAPPSPAAPSPAAPSPQVPTPGPTSTQTPAAAPLAPVAAPAAPAPAPSPVPAAAGAPIAAGPVSAAPVAAVQPVPTPSSETRS